MTKVRRKQICLVASNSLAIKIFMGAHIDALRVNYDITLVANGSADELAELLDHNVSFIPLPIKRKISIRNDIIALFQLWRLFKKKKFDSVHSITPKAGLLSMLAARSAKVPLRFHTFTGQIWATQKGPFRLLLKLLDRVLALNASRLLADSHSQRRFLIEQKVVKASSIDVLVEGSIAGVDVKRFTYNPEVRREIRLKHQIQNDALVFLYLGRLTRDKGLTDLASAFASAATRNTKIQLLIVGPDEEGLGTEFSSLAQLFQGRVHIIGYTDQPEDYLSAADVLCLPSYREGFPNVPLQAAAVGIPTIASHICGITDAVEDGFTGILHTPADKHEIAQAMLLLASDETLRHRMGNAGRKRVEDKFSETRVVKAFADFYHNFLPLTGDDT